MCQDEPGENISDVFEESTKWIEEAMKVLMVTLESKMINNSLTGEWKGASQLLCWIQQVSHSCHCLPN